MAIVSIASSQKCPTILGKAWIIDDHEIFSAGLEQILEPILPAESVYCFANPEEALDSPAKQVSLIIVDFYIPGYDMCEWIPILKRKAPAAKIIVLSASPSPADRRNSLDKGAHYFVEKSHRPAVLLETIQTAVYGVPINPIEEDVASGLTAALKKNSTIKQNVDLTERQVDVLILVARGHSYKKIAEKLDISSETVKSHLSTIYSKLTLHNRDEASKWARHHGLV